MTPDRLSGHREDPQSLNKYSYVRNLPTVLTDPTGLDFNLPCTANSEMCQGGIQSTTANNIFTPTVISNDKNGNLVDQNGNQYNATMTGAGVSFSQSGSNQSSIGVFANGSKPTTIQGSGDLAGFTFNFSYSNPAGNVTAGGTFTFNGTSEQTENALAKAGFLHYSSDEYDILHPSTFSYKAVDFRSPAQPGTGAASGHFTVHEPWPTLHEGGAYTKLEETPTQGDLHLGEHNNSTPGGFLPHSGEVVRDLMQKYLACCTLPNIP